MAPEELFFVCFRGFLCSVSCHPDWPWISYAAEGPLPWTSDSAAPVSQVLGLQAWVATSSLCVTEDQTRALCMWGKRSMELCLQSPRVSFNDLDRFQITRRALYSVLLTYSQWIFHTLLKAEVGELNGWAVLGLFVCPKWLFQVIVFTVAGFCCSSELPKDVWQGELAWELNGSQDDCPERVLIGPPFL